MRVAVLATSLVACGRIHIDETIDARQFRARARVRAGQRAVRATAFAAIVMLTGCDLLFSLQHIKDQPADSRIDTPPIVTGCFGTGMLANVCVDASLSLLSLSMPVDTSSDPRCQKVLQPAGPVLCVLSAKNIQITDVVTVSGDRPLVLVAEATIEVSQLLDASSRVLRTGAAARTTCASGDGGNGSTGAGGGGGGTFGFIGGNGGPGQNTTATPAPGGNPGTVMALTGVVGGCGGGNGGNTNLTAARGGTGGGALYLIAGTSIHVASAGAINASGGGGAGAQRLNGGGGGGSGGFIGLDAPMLVIDGAVFARGGGGGGGGGLSSLGRGGDDPDASSPALGGGGGTGGGTSGGNGCDSPNGTTGTPGASAVNGAGGGGGGCGVIRAYGQRMGSGVFSPAPT